MCSLAHKDAYFQGFLHCDISPNNILISEDSRFEGGMLIDWDLCKVRTGVEDRTICQQYLTVRSCTPQIRFELK